VDLFAQVDKLPERNEATLARPDWPSTSVSIPQSPDGAQG
jgi:hypothetical protein